MSRIKPLAVEELGDDMRVQLKYAEKLMGFTPNDVLIMARWPAFLNAVKNLVDVVYAPGELDAGLKRMIGTIVSGAAGCRYCQAHTAHGAVNMAGADASKVADLWSFETDPRFDEAERAALSLALAAGAQPNAATDDHFENLGKHFTDQQIMEIMGVVSVFGLLNRWNDTLATELEAPPLSFAQSSMHAKDWEPGRHTPRS